MNKMSAAFLLGFAAVIVAGEAAAQGGTPASLFDQAAAVAKQSASSLKTGTPAPNLGNALGAGSLSADVLKSSPSATLSGLKASGQLGSDAVSSAKIGQGTAASAGTSPLANALSSAAIANALKSDPAANAGGPRDFKAVAAIGAESSSLRDAVGTNREIATQRIGN